MNAAGLLLLETVFSVKPDSFSHHPFGQNPMAILLHTVKIVMWLNQPTVTCCIDLSVEFLVLAYILSQNFSCHEA